jgi:hypothetical protein
MTQKAARAFIRFTPCHWLFKTVPPQLDHHLLSALHAVGIFLVARLRLAGRSAPGGYCPNLELPGELLSHQPDAVANTNPR